MPFDTAYLYVRDHISSCIVTTLTNGARVDLSDSSGISGGCWQFVFFGAHTSHGNAHDRDFSSIVPVFRLSTRVWK
jgi:hypothetical protein